ncbi:MAG: NADPH-dependent glutamate synthase [Candidatus Omnitrophota bacterium]
MKKEPVKVSELNAAERASTFDEVVAGYSESDALKEASRCARCKTPACISGCPVGVDIKTFISKINERDYEGAYFTIRQKNDFPAICGRVCPAEYQCRRACIFTKKGSPFAAREAINIHFLERFVGDYGIKNNLAARAKKVDAKPARTKAAVIGSGPAGLACAGELARNGISVTVFEGLHKSGGVLRYGIPPFRMPRSILDFEIDSLKKMGVDIVPNYIVGRVKSIGELFKEGYSAVFLGLGAGIPSFMGIKGEDLCNIYSANEFLTRVNLMSAYKFPEFHTPVNIGRHVIVIGGGNTAMDAARAALRLQRLNNMAPDTTIIYRRTEVEMPARRLEIEHAKEEGIKFRFLVKPEGFLGDEKGFVKKIKCLECRLGEPDSSGRRRPVEIAGSSFDMACDMAVIAVGLKANALLTKVTPELKLDQYGDVVVDKDTMATSIEGVFAGGDIAGGEGTVIEAMGMAKRASKSIVAHLSRQRRF